MHRWFVIALALGGCADREASELATVRDAVCACKTAACADAAIKGVPHGEIRSSHRAQVIARSMLDCLAKLYDGERPSTDPDAPSEPAPPSTATATPTSR